MDNLLKFIGYDNDLEPKEKFTYIITGVCLFILSTFFIFYIIYIQSFYVNLSSGFCLFLLFIVLVLLKFRKMNAAKNILFMAFIIQESLLVFFWFSPQTNLNFFFFIVPPISFFIYDFEIKRERKAIILFNITASVLLLISVVFPLKNSVVNLSPFFNRIISIMSVLSSLGAITVVFYFYSENLSSKHRTLNLLAQTDSLTNILNRRVLFKEGNILFQRCKNNDMTFSFIIFDLDFFKKINDTHGHLAGDRVLKEISRLVSGNIRQHDLFSRYGGEEFAIIMKNTSHDHLMTAAENIRKLIESHTFILENGTALSLTISLGVVSFSSSHQSFEEMVKRADSALYKAKKSGRNRVEAGD